MCVQSFCHVQLFMIPWTVAHQAPLSMGFYWQEYWSGLAFSTPRELPHPGINSVSPVWQADSLPLSHQGSRFDDFTTSLLVLIVLITVFQ